jgi:hypothetical protein
LACLCYYLSEATGESHRAPLKTNDKRDQKSVWFHAWEVDRASHFLGTTTYGEIQGAKEGPALEKAYDKTSWNVMWWTLEKHKSQQSKLTSSSTCTVTSVRTSDGDTDE